MRNIDLFQDYENAKLSTAEEYVKAHRDNTFAFDRLPMQDVEGIPV